MLSTTAGLFGFVGPAAAVGPCTDVQIIGLRGAGEPSKPVEHGMGSVAGPVADAIAQEDPGGTSFSFHGVVYPARATSLTTVLDPPYFAGVTTAEEMLHSYLASEITACPSTKFVVIAYDQGAHAAGDQLAHEPPSITDHVAALFMFGSPRFNSNAPYARGTFDPRENGLAGARPTSDFSGWSSRVFSFCSRSDIICQGAGPGNFASLHAPALYYGSYAESVVALARPRLGLPAPPAPTPRLDVAFVIDSSGSMQNSIDGVADIADDITQTLSSNGTDFQVGLVDYKDVDQGDAYASRVDLPMTANAAAFGTAVNNLTAGGGGDVNEAVFSGLTTAVQSLAWRSVPRKAIILMGDSPPKNPEPVTGLTTSAVVGDAQALGAVIYPVVVGDRATDEFQRLADGTGGELFQASQPSEAADQIVAAVDKVSTPVFTGLMVGSPARPGTEVRFSAAASFSEVGDITSYAWDFDGDGTADATTTSPRALHVYDAPFAGTASVTVTTEDGSQGAASADVDIRATAPIVAGAPQDLRVKAGSDARSLHLAWAAPADAHGGTIAGYQVEITDARGTIVEEIALDGRRRSVVATGLTPGRYMVELSAVNEAGAGPGARRAAEIKPPTPAPPVTTRAPAQHHPAGANGHAAPPLSLTALSISPARLRAAASGPTLSSSRGARLSYRLSRAAGVTLRFERVVRGRLRGHRCRRVARSQRHGKRCVRYRKLAASVTRPSAHGTTTVTFTGRLGDRRLKPGRYRLSAVAVDSAGQRSAVQRVGFRILRRKHRPA